jgi:hypothetical protein
MTKVWVLAAAMGVLLGGGVLAPDAAQARTCFSGFHLDAHGRCQRNQPLPPRHACPPGHFADTNTRRRRGYNCRPIQHHTSTRVTMDTGSELNIRPALA